jgi:hypothetical protein
MGLDMANDFWNKYYGSFVGARILSFEGMNTEDDYGDGFPEFTVQFANGEIGLISVSQDPEGNGGGFLFGLALPAEHPQGGEVRTLNA